MFLLYLTRKTEDCNFILFNRSSLTVIEKILGQRLKL